jgi:hypothetical protein
MDIVKGVEKIGRMHKHYQFCSHTSSHVCYHDGTTKDHYRAVIFLEDDSMITAESEDLQRMLSKLTSKVYEEIENCEKNST